MGFPAKLSSKKSRVVKQVQIDPNDLDLFGHREELDMQPKTVNASSRFPFVRRGLIWGLIVVF